MDLSSAFKSEVFRPLVTLVIPGATALAPYVLLLRGAHQEVRNFWNDHTTSAFLITGLASVAVGLLLEGLGARIEQRWDARLERTTGKHVSTWYRYLTLTLPAEPIGQRYLRTVTLALKFELAMAVAIPVMFVGLLWWDWRNDIMSLGNAILLGLLCLLLTAYLVYESWCSAKVLGRVRAELVAAIDKVAV